MKKFKKLIYCSIILAVLLAILQIWLMNKGYITISFVNCLILQTIVVLLVITMLWQIPIPMMGPNTMPGVALLVVIAFIIVLLPSSELYYYFHHGFSGIILEEKCSNPFMNLGKPNFPFLYFQSISDASYGGLIAGGTLGAIIGIVHMVVKIVKN